VRTGTDSREVPRNVFGVQSRVKGSGLQLRDLECFRKLSRVGFSGGSDRVFPRISAPRCSPSSGSEDERRLRGRAPHPDIEEAEVWVSVKVFEGEDDEV